MSHALANAARLLAEPARAAMLLELMGGRTVPAGELALAAHVTPQTASEHLARLAEAGFITARRQGRHRYYGLATTEVAHAVESLLVLSTTQRNGSLNAIKPAVGTLEYARTCYAHLAGWLGVAITDALQREGHLLPAARRAFAVTDSGRTWFEQFGIALPRSVETPDPKMARQCLDWTERRPHLAGTLGVALYKRLLELRWVAPVPKTRAIRITLEGRQFLSKHLRLTVS